MPRPSSTTPRPAGCSPRDDARRGNRRKHRDRARPCRRHPRLPAGLCHAREEPVESQRAHLVDPWHPDLDAGYQVEGIGGSERLGVLDLSVIDEAERVTDEESFAMTRRLVREEGVPRRWFVRDGGGSRSAGGGAGVRRASCRHPGRFLGSVSVPAVDEMRRVAGHHPPSGWFGSSARTAQTAASTSAGRAPLVMFASDTRPGQPPILGRGQPPVGRRRRMRHCTAHIGGSPDPEAVSPTPNGGTLSGPLPRPISRSDVFSRHWRPQVI